MATKTLTVACAAYTYRVDDDTRIALTGDEITVENDARTKRAVENGWLVDPKKAESARAAVPTTTTPASPTPPAGISTGGDPGGAETPPDDASVEDLLGWVGDDPARARTVYDAETEKPKKEQRSTLLEPLESKLNS